MKKILMLSLMVTAVVWGQENKVTGILKDAQTLEPIAYVSIDFENKQSNNTGAISNENGEFSLSDNSSRVIFSHINYETVSFTLNNDYNEIFLQPKIYELDEVIVSKTTPRNHLKTCIKISSNKLEENTVLKSFCREIVKVNNIHTKYSDALVDYYIMKGNGNSKIVVSQHRAIKKNHHNTNNDTDIEEINTVFNVKEYVKKAYDFDLLDNLLRSNAYEFERKLKREANGEEYERVDIIPNKSIKELLFTGYVIIDPMSQNILEFKIYSSPEHIEHSKLKNFLIAKARINNMVCWSKFRNHNNEYMLSYYKKNSDVHIKMGNTLDHDFNFCSDLFVYDIEKKQQVPEKVYTKKTLFEAGTGYHEEYWKKHNVFPLSKSEQEFVDSKEES
jgi:hypothetical protein